MIDDATKDKVMSNLLRDCDFEEAKHFLEGLPMEKKHRKLLLKMYAEDTPNKTVAFNMGISERQLYELAGQARIHAYNGLRAKLCGLFVCRTDAEQERLQ